MATVIQRPDQLSLLGNLKSFLISSSSPVVFKLEKSDETVVIEESYTPDADGVVEVDIKGVVAQFLSASLPSSDVFSQDGISDSFSAFVDGALAGTFTVVKCGVRKIADTVENFLKANWLTWQPQTKIVRWHQPEYLTYYHVVAGAVKAKFYFVAGGTETVTVASASAGECKSYNMQLSHLFSLSGHDAEDLDGIVDVWVESSGGVRLSYIQRYLFVPDTRNEHYFLCANSLGGIDTFCFTGAQALAPALAHDVAELSGAKIDVSADLTRSWSQNTGAFGKTEAKWMWEFFAASLRWAVMDEHIEQIVVDSSSVRASDGENVNSCDFSFSLSEEGSLLKIARDSGELPAIRVPSPSGEIFFLAPRVVDYPDANLSDALLFLVQSPFVQEWNKLSLGSLTDYITESIRLTAWGQLAHSHSNKAVIDLFSVDAETGKLLFGGDPVASEGGDYNSLSHLPTINNVVIKGNKLASDFGLVGPDMFELDTTSVPGKTLIKAKYDGLYTVGSLAAGAPGSEPEASGALFLLSDVAKSNDGRHVGQTEGGLPAAPGQVLGFNGTKWVASDVQGGGSSVSWGIPSGGAIPLTVDDETKSILLSTALDGYLQKSGGQMSGPLHMYLNKITLCTYTAAADCALYADASENVYLDAYRSIYLASRTGSVYANGSKVATASDLSAYALLNGSTAQAFSAKSLTIPSTGVDGFLRIGNAMLWYDAENKALRIQDATPDGNLISIITTGNLTGGR